MFRKHLTILACALALGLTFATTQAKAATVHFRFTGGAWGHEVHRGWHRYWGGPEIGFYYAPTPVYVVDGYSDPDYYSGPDFWYSNPSFGFDVRLGGGYRVYDDHVRGRIEDVHVDRDRGYRVVEHGDRVIEHGDRVVDHGDRGYIYGDRGHEVIRDSHSFSEDRGHVGGGRGEISRRDGVEGHGGPGGRGDGHDRR